MVCRNCGHQSAGNGRYCIMCGANFSSNDGSKLDVDKPSHLVGLGSCCFPFIGVILYFVWKDDKPRSAKLIFKWMLAGFTVWVLAYLVIFISRFFLS